MDDTTKLVRELQDKLTELDGKVAAYQRDMLAEFERHMADCLKGYPDHVTSEVSRVIAESMYLFPAMNPTAASSRTASPTSPGGDSGPPVVPGRASRNWDGRKSPPPILRHTSGTPTRDPHLRNPHAREKEFHGLFTPTYLPLLESSDRRQARGPPETTTADPARQRAPLSEDNVKMVPADEPAHTPISDNVPSSDKGKDNESEGTPVVQLNGAASSSREGEVRRGPIRRLTDRSTSSIESSSSEAKVRRSALRRTSSSTRGSPRRVRFEVQGAEVFPSASSPQASPTVLRDLESSGAEPLLLPPPMQQPVGLPDTASSVINSTAAAVTAEADESQTFMNTSLLDVEGEEDSLPRPKKVSSTQALQALTRSPLEEGSVWTVVNADGQEPAKTKSTGDDQLDGTTTKDTPEPPQKLDLQTTTPAARDVEDESLDALLGSPIEELEQYNEDSSDEEFLSMKPKSGGGSSKKLAAMASASSSGGSKMSPASILRNPSAPGPASLASVLENDSDNMTPRAEDADPFFEFEPELDGPVSEAAKKPKAKYIIGDDDEDEDEEDERPRRPDRLVLGAAGQPTPPQDADEEPTDNGTSGSKRRSLPPMSPSSVLFGHGVGSYKGTTMRINPINNPDLYDEIANMRDVHFFVGSVDGRTGTDTADLSSYRAATLPKNANAGAAAVTPRSFTERLALEEEMERRRAMTEEE